MTRLAITVRGIVQGVGFRPFVYNAAMSQGLSGWVINESDCVRIEIEGPAEKVQRFMDILRHQPPPQASIDQIDAEPIKRVGTPASDVTPFEIRESTAAARRRPTIPADLVTCRDCRAEITSAEERRYHYPFTNCTNCGPRWSIITGLPYDRPRTSMSPFKMCTACQREYEDPADRRFHAQPIACPECGPTLQLINPTGVDQARGSEALQAAAKAVQDGAILALKGLGGFQLVVDATNDSAVRRLRQRKHRPVKPFAIMLPDPQTTARYCQLSEFERAQLTSPQGPIMLLRRKDEPTGLSLASAVAPGNPQLGVMLPNTPLHALLLAHVERPIICTSGNRAEEPMATEVSEVLARLADIADLILTHDRPIVRPVDDSVCREVDGSLQILRRARGYAPVAIRLAESAPCILAVGGHLKNTVALSIGDQVVVGSHVGDLDNTLSLDVHRRAIADLVGFFEATPEWIACDMHPDYASTQYAAQLARRWNTPLVHIQHHHAHVLSAMAEHQLEGPVLGLAWDGTGYGPDRTIWGGEAILVAGAQWERVAHLRPFLLPGGDRAAREPRRSALGLLHAVGSPQLADLARSWFSDMELATLCAALERPGLFPLTSSMGRLFDGVAALCGLGATASFEGQAAMALEFATADDASGRYELPLQDEVANWQPMVEQVVCDRSRGVPVSHIAARFHNSLTHLALQISQRVGCPQVVLTGGCFQNHLLAERTRATLSEAGFEVYTQQMVPPGDGGLSLGQVLGSVYQVGE
jgi:hydrogenase maturation protein HypF